MTLAKSVVLLVCLLWAMGGLVVMSKPVHRDFAETTIAVLGNFGPLVGAIIFWFAPRRRSK